MGEYDVAVVGASIAGCTAATFLGRAGARVALVESHGDPKAFKRVCTHAIQPSAGPTLDRLGVTEAVVCSGARRGGMNLWTRYGWISFAHEWAEPPLCDHPIWNIRRETLDPMLRELAAATEGVELMLGHTANALLCDGPPVGGRRPPGRVRGVVVRTRDGTEHELRAKLVVAADGRDSQIAKLASQRTKLKPHNRFCYYAYYRNTPVVTGDSAQFWLLDPDVAYAFPTDAGLTLLACMIHRDRLPEFRDDPERAMARLFESLPDAPRLDPAKRESQVIGKLDMPNVRRRAWRPGLAFVGDAALAVDPLWGIGCGWALQSGEWLAEAAIPALDGEEAQLDGALRVYARRHRRAFAEHELLCSAYATGRKLNLIQRLIYRGAARDREIAGGVALIGGRWITPRQMLTPRMVARIVRVNLSRASRPMGLRTERPSPTPVAG
ncbi:MAG TPA: NAD(P)/FAD-dependent oxidoreductase [Solirubrobacteraceae bacterium]|jgi:flavin-dependent dehydrogenase|nr:NAD(P)/FAD-dependent oxidoreductase [Solirubrobacteraceae bacterium]